MAGSFDLKARIYSTSFWLTSGGIVLSVLSAVAQQERITLSERVRAGLKRAVKDGKVLGRRAVAVDVRAARKLQREGLGLRPVAKKLGCSVNTLRRALGDTQKRSARHYGADAAWHDLAPESPRE